jgi:hypothetical protein
MCINSSKCEKASITSFCSKCFRFAPLDPVSLGPYAPVFLPKILEFVTELTSITLINGKVKYNLSASYVIPDG